MGSSGSKAYVALFRGINIGGRNILPMKGLTEILEAMGCEKVATYIQSGNAVFLSRVSDRTVLAESIGQSVKARYGFEPRVLLLDGQALDEAVTHNPYDSSVGKNLHFLFLEAFPDTPDLAALEAVKTDSEAFTLKERVFYLYTPDGFGRSKLVPKIEKSLGVAATGRNWNTVQKLLDMLRALEHGITDN